MLVYLEKIRCVSLCCIVISSETAMQRTWRRNSDGRSIIGNRPLVPMAGATAELILMALVPSTRLSSSTRDGEGV